MKNSLQRTLAMVLFFSFIFGALCIFAMPLYSADWSGIPTWNPGDGRDVIKSLSVIEPGRNLVVAESEESLGNYYPDVLLYTMDDNGNKLTGPFHYGGFWTAYANDGFAEYDSESGQYVFNVVGEECISYNVCQATFFRVYEDGTYVQNGQGENWYHFFNPEGEEFIDASSLYNSIKRLFNGNYLAVGEITMPNALNKSTNPLVVYFSSDGEVLWYKVLNGSEVGKNYIESDVAVDFVMSGEEINILIDSKSEGPGTEYGNHAYRITRLSLAGECLNSENFGGIGDDFPKKIFMFNNELIVLGKTDDNGNISGWTAFVSKINFDLVEDKDYYFVLGGEDLNSIYAPKDGIIEESVLHLTGSTEYRLFHIGIDLINLECTYNYIVAEEGARITGLGLAFINNGILVAGLRYVVGGDDDFFLSFLDLSPEIQTQEISLNAGWNLISFYVQPEDTDISVVLSSVLTDCEKVWTLDDGVWKLYDPADLFFSDLLEMHAGQGYMLKMSSSALLSVSGAVLDEPISLSTGWEMPGFLSDVAYSSEDALASIMGKYEKVWTIEDGLWKLYDPADLFFSDLLEMKPGQGYMMKLNDNCSWILN